MLVSPPRGRCLVCLEDGRGGCARDHQGRPILASIGMPYGTVAEQEAQMIYAMQVRPGW